MNNANSTVGTFDEKLPPAASNIILCEHYYSSTADAVPLLSQEKANIALSSVNSFIINLLSEARLRLPSPVGEGAELAEADEVSAVPTAKLGRSGIKIVTVYPDGVI